MIRVLYMVWWEGALENPLIHRQVGGLVRALSQIDGVEVQLLIADAFWKVRVQDRLRGTHRAMDLNALRDSLPGVTVHVRQTPIFPRASRWYAKKALMDLLVLGHAGWIRRLCRREKIDVIHCRSYPATVAALRSKTGRPVVMDTRGNYPEEAVVTGAFEHDSADFRSLKTLEAELYENAAAIVSVTDRASSHIRASGVATPTFTVPTSTDQAPFANLPDVPRRGLVYIGAMRTDSLINAASLLELYLGMRPHLAEPHLRIVTLSDHEALRAFFGSSGIREPELELRASRSPQESATLLNECRFAALPFQLPPNATPAHELIGRHILAVKTGEYHAAGLPLLVSERVGGASDVVRELGSGVVYGSDTDWPAVMNQLQTNYQAASAAARAGAARFDVSEHARMYRDIYSSLLPDRISG